MTKSDVFGLTTHETLYKIAKEKLGPHQYTDASHPLFMAGFYAGMEALAESIAATMQERKLLEGPATSDK